MVGRNDALHACDTLQRVDQGLRVLVLAEVKDERIGLLNLVGELGLSAQRDQFAVVDDTHTMREFLGFLHVMRGVEHGHSLAVELLDRVENSAPRLGIDAHGWLIHEEQAGAVQQSHADVHPPFHPAGVGLDTLLCLILQADLLEHLIGACGQFPAGKPVHLTPKTEVLLGGQVLVECQFLRHYTNAFLDRHGFLPDRMTAYQRVTAGGGVEGGKDRNGRGFPRSVGSQQAEDFALFDVKGDAFDGSEIAVFFDQVVHLENGGHVYLACNIG